MLQFYKKKKLYAKAEQSNSQVYRKKSFQKCSCISTRCQFNRAWVKRAQWTELWNAKQNNMNFIIWLYQNFMNVSNKIFKKNKEILLFFSVFALLCWAQLSSKKCFSTLTKFPPFCTVHTNINKSFNSFYILHNIIYVLWKVSSMSS